MLQEALIKVYRRPQANRLLFVIALYLCKIYQINKRNFRKNYGRISTKAATCKQVEATESLKIDDDGVRCKVDNSACDDKWDWTDIPRLWSILTYYERFATAYYVWAVIKNWMPDRVIQTIGWFKPPMKAHCYLLGHFLLHDAISKYVVILMGTGHLLYRTSQFLANRAYSLTMLNFLIITERDLNRFIECLHRHNERNLELHLHEGSGVADNLQLAGAESLSIDLEHLFRDTLCFRVEYKDKIIFRVRPHRTAEAQRLLHRRVAQTVYYTGCLLAAIVAAVLPALLPQLVSNKRYLRWYPGCNPELDCLLGENKLKERSFPWNFHQTLTILVDSCESLMLWLDSGLACIINWPLVYLLNYDNLLYWEKVDARLRHLYAEVRVHYEASACPSAAEGLPSASRGPQPTATNWLKQRLRDPAELDRQLYELRAELHDFFHHISKTDAIISDVITTSIIAWLSCFSVFSVMSNYTLSTTGARADLIVLIYTLELIAFLIVTAGSFSLLALHKNCLKSYVTICALMAYDQSKQKRSYASLMEFYTVKKRSAYTVFQQYPYTKTTYLSIFGWTLTCFFIIDSMLH